MKLHIYYVDEMSNVLPLSSQWTVQGRVKVNYHALVQSSKESRQASQDTQKHVVPRRSHAQPIVICGHGLGMVERNAAMDVPQKGRLDYTSMGATI